MPVPASERHGLGRAGSGASGAQRRGALRVVGEPEGEGEEVISLDEPASSKGGADTPLFAGSTMSGRGTGRDRRPHAQEVSR